ncbi:MAG TPA: phosphotransferase [Solirubrobacterales bacterium]
MGKAGGYGVRAWTSPEWREAAVAWIDARLADAGLERTGAVEQPHVRPWATVLRVPTADGPLWMKAAGPGTAFEVPLYEILARVAPDRVLVPLATDAERAWALLLDGGPSLGERLEDAERVDALAAALVEYGRLQRSLEPHVDELLAAGVADMRPAAMPGRFGEAVAVAGEVDGVAAAEPEFGRWCARLAESPLPASLDHNDLHPWNVLGSGKGVRFYDWGDAVVAHPFAAMLVPLGFVERGSAAGLADPRFTRARDAYLEVFTDVAPRAELVEELELACRVAKVARVLTWERALRAAREQDEEIDPYFVNAPAETLASVLDESYVGGA